MHTLSPVNFLCYKGTFLHGDKTITGQWSLRQERAISQKMEFNPSGSKQIYCPVTINGDTSMVNCLFFSILGPFQHWRRPKRAEQMRKGNFLPKCDIYPFCSKGKHWNAANTSKSQEGMVNPKSVKISDLFSLISLKLEQNNSLPHNARGQHWNYSQPSIKPTPCAKSVQL